MKKIIILFIILSIHLSGNCQILKKPIPDKLVVLTFDDATESQYTVVAPLLKKFGFDATFFVCEFQSNNKDSLIYMNWNQIQELNKMGFEVANHTRTHPSVNQLPKTQFLEELNYIEGKCDSLDIEKPSSFAYPGYNLSSPGLETLHEKGYISIKGLNSHINVDEAFKTIVPDLNKQLRN